jgi:drug/metabolite transporter (DMT)-like permease
MRSLANALGIALIFLGALWLLQEYNFVPGSFLDNQVSFTHRGAVSVGAGILVMVLGAISSAKRR